MRITADEYNPSSLPYNISTANDWLYPPDYLNPLTGCGANMGPVGFGIFQGYFDFSNYTSAKTLALYNSSFEYWCATVVPGVLHYTFSPHSSSVTASWIGEPTYSLSEIVVSVETNGYWTGGNIFGVTNNGGPAQFHKFSSGIYTVIAADEWDKVVFVHLQISSNGSITGTGGVTSTFTTSTTPVLTLAESNMCLQEVKGTIDDFQNSTFIGYEVTYGTTSYYPLGGCPSPVDPTQYALASVIEANASFTAAEKNYTYVVDPIASMRSVSVSTSGSVQSFVVFQFDLYSNQRITPCGSGSFWTLRMLGNIQVYVPINPDGTYNLSDIGINSQFSTSGVQMFSCTTQITTTQTR
jgi:hypothetical protein